MKKPTKKRPGAGNSIHPAELALVAVLLIAAGLRHVAEKSVEAGRSDQAARVGGLDVTNIW